MKSNISILIVEDDFATRMAMTDALISLGYEDIHTAKNSQEATKLLENNGFDLALLDIGLAKSEMDGITLAKEINDLYPHIKLIFTSSFSDQSTLERSSQVLHQNYLIKPVGNEQLSVSIQKAFTPKEELQIPHSSRDFQCPFSVVQDEVYIKSKNDKYYYKVNIRDILFLETSNKGVEFHTLAQRFFTYTSLSETLLKLNHPSIVQIHKRYAVNMQAIKAKSESDILLINDKELPIGRSFKTDQLNNLFLKL